MALDKCNDAVVAAIGRELTQREKGIVSRRASDLKRKIDLAKNDPGQVDNILKTFADDVQMQSALTKRTAALNYAAYATLKSKWDNVPYFMKNPAEAWKALMRGSLDNFEDARDSLAHRVQHESMYRAGTMVADLEKVGLTDYAFNGKDDLNIVKAMWDIRNGIKADTSKYGKNAVAVATILDKHLENLRQDHNAAGAFIAKNSDRLFRRTHDANRIAKAGGNTWGSTASRDAWVKFVGDRMDWDKSFGGSLKDEDEDERTDVLRQIWKDFSSHSHLKDGQEPQITLGSKNYGKRLSTRRQIVFRGPADDLAYQQNFGTGASVTQNVFNNLKGGGRDLALMQRLGPNPESTLRKLSHYVQTKLDKTGTPNDITAFNKAVDDEFDNTWRILTESTVGHPEGNVVARFLSNMRQITSVAAVGGATFVLPIDMALKASRMAQMTGDGVAKSLAHTIADQVSPTGLSKAEHYRLLTEHGIRIEGVHLPMDPDLADHVGTGAITKFNKLMMRVTPHAYWDNGVRLRSLVADGYRYWTMRDKSWDKLDAPVRDTFAQFGITEKGWDALRNLEGTKLDNDKNVLEARNVREAPLENFKELAGGNNPSNAQLTRARDNLTTQYRNLLGEKADRDVTAPSIANRAAVGLGKKGLEGGTVYGELVRGALALKGWVLNYMMNHLGREIHGYTTVEHRTTGQAIVDMVRVWDREHFNPKALSGVARLIAAGVPIAYASNQLRNLATGKEMEDPTKLATWKRAFARQSFGLYSDFLLQDANPEASIWDRLGHTAAGPEFGLYADMANSVIRLVAQANSTEGITPEKLGEDERRWFQMGYRNVPGTQLFWTKFALDYMVLNPLSEMLSPGYQERLIERAQKQGTPLRWGAGPQTAP